MELVLEGRKRRQKQTKLTCGVGVNDCKFPLKSVVDGVLCTHRSYNTWKNILFRCFDPHTQSKFPTYIGCHVSDEWLYFSNFHKWWRANFREGWVVDKDLLFPGNKVYSPDRCLYIPEELNNFVISREAKRGTSPIGSTFDSAIGMYITTISIGKGKKVNIGVHKTAEEAYAAWLDAKLKLAERFKPVCDEIHPQLYDSLLTKIRSIK
ncbi:TPA: hypothetical protein ACW46Q_000444 [Salmonella enterica subsp. enterica serovar Nagoya]